MTFLAEDEEIAVLKMCVAISFRALCGQKVEVTAVLILFKQFVERVVITDVQILPVIKPRAL